MRVPEGWEVKYLSELANRISDGIHTTPVYVNDSDVYFINGNNLKNGSIVIQDSTRCVDKADAVNHRKDLGGRTLLMSINGTIGNLAYYRGENVVLGKSASYINIKDNVDLDFIYNVLSSSITQRFYESELTGTTIRNLSIKSIKNTRVATPPIPEQQKIAQILSTWDKAITTTEQLLANSQQQKKALMQQLLTGKKRLLDEDGVRFSGEWLSKFLGDFCEISTGKSNREDSTSSSGMYTFFDRSQDIRTSNIFLFDTEAVIVAGEGQEFVPKYFSGKFDLHQRTYAIMGFANSWGKFIYFYLGHFNSFLLSQAVGSTVKSLRLPMFQKMPIKLPSLKEQQKIATVLTIADREIELLQTKLEALKQEKKALMQQLLTGKRRVVINH